MKYRIRFTSTFKKSYKRAKKRGYKMQFLDHVIELLQQGEQLDRKYRDHALVGKIDWLS